MLNERIDILQTVGGDALQLRFDLPDAELGAIARGVSAFVAECYRDTALDADGVLELRELTALQESARERAEDGYDGGTLVMSVRRLGLLTSALDHWLRRRIDLGFMRSDEAFDQPVIERLVDELRELHMRSLQAAIATGSLSLA
jgi:hypothetical protein